MDVQVWTQLQPVLEKFNTNLERVLRKELADLEINLEQKHSHKHKRILWTELACLAVGWRNVQLCKLAVSRLNHRCLCLAMDQSLSSNLWSVKSGQLVALLQASAFFRVHQETLALLDEITRNLMDEFPTNTSTTLFDLNPLLELFVNMGLWDRANQLLETAKIPQDVQIIASRRLLHLTAAHRETEGCFAEAVNIYNQATSPERTLARASAKWSALDNTDRIHIAINLGEKNSDRKSNDFDLISELRHFFAIQQSEANSRGANSLLEKIPSKLLSFLHNQKPLDQIERRTLSHLCAIVTDLAPNERRCLAILSKRMIQNDDPLAKGRSPAIWAVLGGTDIATRLAGNPLIQMKRALDIMNSSDSSLIPTLTTGILRVFKHLDSATDYADILAMALFRLGLINEALQVCLRLGRATTERMAAVTFGIDMLEEALDMGQIHHLRMLDPYFRLGAAFDEKKGDIRRSIASPISDTELATGELINLLILSVALFLHKIDDQDNEYDDYNDEYHGTSKDHRERSDRQRLHRLAQDLDRLQDMFEDLVQTVLPDQSIQSEARSFKVTDALVEASCKLISGVKARLYLLVDHELIASLFKRLMNCVASRCLMDCRYRDAARLYSLLEDNLAAAKALMRTGELELVINYALLIGDMTVSRVTLNYLRHMGADRDLIERFKRDATIA